MNDRFKEIVVATIILAGVFALGIVLLMVA